MKRVFLIVLDSLGIGYAPDADYFGDVGANTLASVSELGALKLEHLVAAGMGNIQGVTVLPTVVAPTAAVARLEEISMGKDTTVGHWELAGVVSKVPLPTYPNGFPAEILEEFSRRTGRKVLCNMPYSGTDVIRDFGRQHVETGALIVYTSADSVFQIAAHEAVVPPQKLYEYCEAAREILTGKHGVGRVIARPFDGEHPYNRTTNRHDFSLQPPGQTILDAVKSGGQTVIGVGKISDIFAGRGLTQSYATKGNAQAMEQTILLAQEEFGGLCFVNLVDFDMLYGHRQDPVGYAAALMAFDQWLPGFLEALRQEDLVILTADHGCDPGDDSTDHTREYVPMLAMGSGVKPMNLGTRRSFADVAATIAQYLDVPYEGAGESFCQEI